MSEPNLQNIPIPLSPEQREQSNKIRDAFMPRVGRIFFEANFSQLEIRFAALLAEEGLM